MSTYVMQNELTLDDLQMNKVVKVVRMRDCEPFSVERVGISTFILTNRTHFLGGQRIVRSFADVKSVIDRT